jgi:hypothetical protein
MKEWFTTVKKEEGENLTIRTGTGHRAFTTNG